jgi:hypothetical protein
MTKYTIKQSENGIFRAITEDGHFVMPTYTTESAEKCEELLRAWVANPIDPDKVIREVEL